MVKKISLILIITTLLCVFATAMVFPVSRTANAEEKTINHTLGAAEVTLIDGTSDLTTKLSAGTSEDYRPSSRKWNGISTAIGAGNNMYAAWYTGGDKEPHADNYIVVAASDDNGLTWKDPFMVIDPINGKKALLPVFFKNGAGDILLYYATSSNNLYGIKFINADGPLANVTYQELGVVSQRSMFVKPTILKNGNIIYASGDITDTIDKNRAKVYISTDDGYHYTEVDTTLYSQYKSPNRMYTEASIVELSNGTLWMLSRLEAGYDGGIEQAFSYDGGYHWTNLDAGLPYPLQGPGSRSAFIKLKSGNLLFITNDSMSQRIDLTVFMSTDDGETWPYSLLIDPNVSAYPEVFEWDDGKILLAYDKGRYSENSIRVSVFTEEDIKAGEFVSKYAVDKATVTKGNDKYRDIIDTNGAFRKNYTYKVGTPSSKIREQLPTTFTVTDEYGKDWEITGQWKSAGYKQDVAGEYKITFSGDLPGGLMDSYNKLIVKVTLTPKKKGCGNVSLAVAVLSCLGVAFVLTKRK